MCLNEPIEMETTCEEGDYQPHNEEKMMLLPIAGGMRLKVGDKYFNLFPARNPIKFIGRRAVIRIAKKNKVSLVFSDKVVLCTIKRFIRDCGWKP